MCKQHETGENWTEEHGITRTEIKQRREREREGERKKKKKKKTNTEHWRENRKEKEMRNMWTVKNTNGIKFLHSREDECKLKTKTDTAESDMLRARVIVLWKFDFSFYLFFYQNNSSYHNLVSFKWTVYKDLFIFRFSLTRL